MEKETRKMAFSIERYDTGNYSVLCGERKARILCTDLKGPKKIVAAVWYHGEEIVVELYSDGRFFRTKTSPEWDLTLVDKQ